MIPKFIEPFAFLFTLDTDPSSVVTLLVKHWNLGRNLGEQSLYKCLMELLNGAAVQPCWILLATLNIFIIIILFWKV